MSKAADAMNETLKARLDSVQNNFTGGITLSGCDSQSATQNGLGGAIFLNGGGTINLSNSPSNTSFQGSTTVSSGTLKINRDSIEPNGLIYLQEGATVVVEDRKNASANVTYHGPMATSFEELRNTNVVGDSHKAKK